MSGKSEAHARGSWAAPALFHLQLQLGALFRRVGFLVRGNSFSADGPKPDLRRLRFQRRLRAECFDSNRRRSSVELFGCWAYPVAYRFACPEVALARCRAAPEYFITIARLLWPVIACTSSSEAPAAVSCAAAV